MTSNSCDLLRVTRRASLLLGPPRVTNAWTKRKRLCPPSRFGSSRPPTALRGGMGNNGVRSADSRAACELTKREFPEPQRQPRTFPGFLLEAEPLPSLPHSHSVKHTTPLPRPSPHLRRQLLKRSAAQSPGQPGGPWKEAGPRARAPGCAPQTSNASQNPQAQEPPGRPEAAPAPRAAQPSRPAPRTPGPAPRLSARGAEGRAAGTRRREGARPRWGLAATARRLGREPGPAHRRVTAAARAARAGAFAAGPAVPAGGWAQARALRAAGRAEAGEGLPESLIRGSDGGRGWEATARRAAPAASVARAAPSAETGTPSLGVGLEEAAAAWPRAGPRSFLPQAPLQAAEELPSPPTWTQFLVPQSLQGALSGLLGGSFRFLSCAFTFGVRGSARLRL